MISNSTDRVPEHTSEAVNREIQARTARSVAHFSNHPHLIANRLKELDAEWDVERALATGSSCLSLAGLALGFLGSRRWFYLPLAVQAFYLQHTLQGWCPPLPVFRRLGFRTPAEIEGERCALQKHATVSGRSAEGASAR
jgi:hypothetical protein